MKCENLCEGSVIDQQSMNKDLESALRLRGLIVGKNNTIEVDPAIKPNGRISWIVPPKYRNKDIQVRYSDTSDFDGYVYRCIVDKRVGSGIYEIQRMYVAHVSNCPNWRPWDREPDWPAQ